MFDWLLYPVSVVMSCCHTALSWFLEPDGGAAWSLSVVLLVVVLRAALVWPTVRQFTAARRVQALAPQVEALRRRFPDRVEFARHQAALHRENGVSAWSGLAPALV